MPDGRTTVGIALIRSELDKNPQIPARKLARFVFNKYPKTWATIDAARSSVRFVLGSHGKKMRHQASHPRPKRKAGEDWKQYLPQEKRTLEIPWAPVVVKGEQRILGLFDIHLPFHDLSALTLSINHGLKIDPTMVVLCGDALDCYALSKYQKNPDLRDFPGEVRDGRMFLKSLRTAFPNARIIWKWGNHEERYEAHMRLNPDFYALDDWKWVNVFRYKDYGIEHVGDKRPIVVGKGLHLVHGHEWGQGTFAPVNPARTYFLKAGVHVIGGHFHQSSQHSAKNLEQNLVSAWSVGCLCEEHPDYRPLNNWSQGFVCIDVTKAGAFQVENKRIVNGQAW